MMSRRAFGARGLACACLAAPLAHAQVPAGPYRCPPCGCAMDGREFNGPGACPACGMALVPTSSLADPAKALSVAEQRADLAVFRSGFMELDRAYSPAARAEAERRLARMEGAEDPVSAPAFLVALCRIAALADNGHSACFYPAPPGATLGFGLVGEQFHVLSAPTGQADLLGARLAGIEGRPMSSVRPAVRSLFGGVPAWRDLRALRALSSPEYLHALGLTTAPDAVTYRLIAASGQTVERRLTASVRDPAWASLPRAVRAPWALQSLDEPFRWRDAPEFDAVMVQLRRNHDAPGKPIAAFLAEAEAARARLERLNVVLDMRPNGGGDFLSTRDFMSAWPGRVAAPGRFFVLVGPATFSAGIASVAYLKQAGGDLVVLIGEPPGDRLMFFAEGRMTRLPHSGAEVVPAGQRDDFATGCKGYDDCFAALAQPGSATGTPADLTALIDQQHGRRPLMVRSLNPDIAAPWTIEDYQSGRDPALTALAAYLGASR